MIDIAFWLKPKTLLDDYRKAMSDLREKETTWLLPLSVEGGLLTVGAHVSFDYSGQDKGIWKLDLVDVCYFYNSSLIALELALDVSQSQGGADLFASFIQKNWMSWQDFFNQSKKVWFE